MDKSNICSIKQKLISQEEINNIKGHLSPTFWLTGLSGSGKSTLSILCEKALFDQGIICKVLDGDNIRSGLTNDLDFTESERSENIRRIAEVNKLFNENGVLTISSFISPTFKMRQMAKEIIGVNNFYEVFVDASLQSCEKRDVKGLYKKARAGLIPNFTGISSSYEKPINPDLVIKTDMLSIDECQDVIVNFIKKKIRIK